MIQESKELAAFIDKNIKRLMKEFVQNSLPWFEAVKARFSLMGETDLDNVVTTAINTSRILEQYNLPNLESVLRGIAKVLKSYTDATSPVDCKKMVKKVTSHLRFAWAAMNQEAKEIVAFALLASYELQRLNY